MSELQQAKTSSIVVGCDHAGYDLKADLIAHLQSRGFSVIDVGCHSNDKADYPLIAAELVQAMQLQGIEKGLLCCGSGIGVSIAANRYTSIRAVLANDLHAAKWSRLHNDANVICLGGRVIAPQLGCEILDIWLDTPFEGGRHEARVSQLGTLTHTQKPDLNQPSAEETSRCAI